MPSEPQKNLQNHYWLKIHPANLIRLAYWRRRVISANTIGWEKEEPFKNFATLLLFVKTSLIV
jgi:hypothetical protein